MIKITSITKTNDEFLTPKQMIPGDIGTIVESQADPRWLGHIVLRTYNMIVDLKQPNSTWDISEEDSISRSTFRIELFKKGSKITLEVE